MLSKLSSFPAVDTVLLCGVETHVCIHATAMDFIERGFAVHVLVDCCSSRTTMDRMYALDRIKAGAGPRTGCRGLQYYGTY